MCAYSQRRSRHSAFGQPAPVARHIDPESSSPTSATVSRRLPFAQRSFTPWLTVTFSEAAILHDGGWQAGWDKVAQINWAGTIGSTYMQWSWPQWIERSEGGERMLVVGRDVRVEASGGGCS